MKRILAATLSMLMMFAPAQADKTNSHEHIVNEWWFNLDIHNPDKDIRWCSIAKNWKTHPDVKVSRYFDLALAYLPKLIPGETLFMISGKDWKIDTDKKYDAEIELLYKDGEKRKGMVVLEQFINDHTLAMMLSEPFKKELLLEPEMHITINGNYMGGYDLTGLKTSMDILESCIPLVDRAILLDTVKKEDS